MKITLPNGMIVEGTAEQVKDVVDKLGYSGVLGDGFQYYFSESKGPVLITGMNTTHLRNAILKFYEEWVNELHEIRNPKVLIEKIMAGVEDKTWLAMVKEYATRKEE